MGECHYLDGNVHAAKAMRAVEYLLDLSGVGSGRLFLRWVSAAEGQQFASYVREFSDSIGNRGPFVPEEFGMPLAALERTLGAPRLRWLMGMEVQVTERGNAYGERVQEGAYEEVLQRAAREEYEKALVLEALHRGHESVRDIAMETGMSVYGVSCRLNELERTRLVGLKGYRGTTPEFGEMGA
jgi:hypothetical protein